MRSIITILLALLISTTAAMAAVTIKLRGDTATNWTSNNPVLALREPGVEIDTSKIKIGDGVTAWNSLGYITDRPSTLAIAANTTLTEAQLLSHRYFSNSGATGTITVTLPAISYEIVRTIIVEENQIVQIAPESGEMLDLPAGPLSVDQVAAGPATVGSKLVITRQRNATGVWMWSLDGARGTWAGI